MLPLLEPPSPSSTSLLQTPVRDGTASQSVSPHDSACVSCSSLPNHKATVSSSITTNVGSAPVYERRAKSLTTPTIKQIGDGKSRRSVGSALLTSQSTTSDNACRTHVQNRYRSRYDLVCQLQRWCHKL
uniref:Breast cancer type 2 susceptibility protein n=1 Tax=Lygus hesperus TaxID=30085 RepID=A0A0A9XX94_LYGHE